MSLKQPLLSVVMATCNGERFLKQQLDSIFAQTFQDFELIICDDASRDDTLVILESYRQQFTAIKIYQNNTRLGIVRNFEKAIGLSTAPYISLCDQDDIWHKDKLTRSMEAMTLMEHSSSISSPLLVHTNLCMIDVENKVIEKSFFFFKKYNLQQEKDIAHIVGRCGVMGNTILMNRALQKRILPFPPILEVHDYWIALVNELYGKRTTLNNPFSFCTDYMKTIVVILFLILMHRIGLV
ncbi:MAG: glycosyltransferase family 2 protein [Sulfurovum sp.]|nr:glycosyltransferase family 2 protein [Sulfurovum sp.]